MTDEAFRIGVVGRGFRRYGLIPAFRRDPRCTVAAICGTDIHSARATAGELSIPNAYGSWEEMLGSEEIDGLAVAAPPHIQPAVLTAGMNSGIAVFAEKPLASSLQDAESLVRLADESGAANVIDFIFPELETWRRALELIQSGTIGDIELVTVEWTLESFDIARGADTWKTSTVAGRCPTLAPTSSTTSSVSSRRFGPYRQRSRSRTAYRPMATL